MTGSVFLIRRALLRDGRTVDVRVAGARIAAIGPHDPRAVSDGAEVIDARGGLLLPGLHDHHAHIAATAAALSSVRCGPPQVMDEGVLGAVLADATGEGWLRGVGYHESVAGMIDRHWIDRAVAGRPVRIQHRSGRMWMFNSAALGMLLASGIAPPQGLDRDSGRLFDADDWLRAAMGSRPPDFAPVGRMLARWGVTGVTDMSPLNDAAAAAHFASEAVRGACAQRVVMAGKLDVGGAMPPAVVLGPVKLHLHEMHLPDYNATVALVRAAHEAGRCVAVHCVTETELVFALATLREAGVRGDRIEHASVAPDTLVTQIAELALAVVAQPNFVSERGDAYLADIPHEQWPYLYRLRAFREARVVLAGGSDTPFGSADPWAAMAAAVSRRTAGKQVIGAGEALTAEQALDLFLADPLMLGRTRVIETGAAADLCLMAQDWETLSADLSAARVRATFVDGVLIHHGIEDPLQRGSDPDPLA